VTAPAFTPLPFTVSDRQHILDLSRYAPRRHLHLDWRSLADWLPESTFCGWLARLDGRARAALGASLQSGDRGTSAAWLRLLIPVNASRSDSTLDALWESLCADLRSRGVTRIGILLFEEWTTKIVRRWGFEPDNRVITFRREGGPIPDPPPTPLAIRPMALADLEDVVRVDAAAFTDPLWRYDFGTLSHALPHASSFDVLEDQGEIVGYQFGTRHIGSGHLARLAVHPSWQGQGHGKRLVARSLHFFADRGIRVVTVNTQHDNYRSRQLYVGMGFRLTDYAVPLWVYRL
jgi:ribosomal protein S18 acetylase RimI-like enzyme